MKTSNETIIFYPVVSVSFHRRGRMKKQHYSIDIRRHWTLSRKTNLYCCSSNIRSSSSSMLEKSCVFLRVKSQYYFKLFFSCYYNCFFCGILYLIFWFRSACLFVCVWWRKTRKKNMFKQFVSIELYHNRQETTPSITNCRAPRYGRVCCLCLPRVSVVLSVNSDRSSTLHHGIICHRW